MIYKTTGTTARVVRQEWQIHHDRGDSTTVAAAAARDEDGGTLDQRLEPGDGRSGLSAIYDMAEDERSCTATSWPGRTMGTTALRPL